MTEDIRLTSNPDTRWMVADEMFCDFLKGHEERRRDSYRRRMLLRERTDLRHPIDREIHDLRRYDAETENLRRQIAANRPGMANHQKETA